MYDVIVVGGGHNGLTCAAYLARAGQRVLVLEAQPVVGGFVQTAETVSEAPGFLMSPYAIEHVLTNIPSSVIDELDLARYGLRFVHPDPWASWLHPDGRSIRFWRNRRRTVDEIARLSPADAARYDEFCQVLRDLWYTAVPYMQGHPRRLDPGMIFDVARRAARTRRNLTAGVRIALQSPAQVIEEWFEGDEMKAALGCYAACSMASIDEPGTGILLSITAVSHEWGARRCVGGAGEFTQALAHCVEAFGGDIRTNAPVREVLVGDGTARGVVLDSGERLDILDGYAPGLKDSVIGRAPITPADLAAHAPRGNLYHVDLGLAQMGPWRPIPSLAGYRTPVEHLWHSAAGAHPMGLQTGWSGRSTARTVLRALRRSNGRG